MADGASGSKEVKDAYGDDWKPSSDLAVLLKRIAEDTRKPLPVRRCAAGRALAARHYDLNAEVR